jgi:hypothetical protein
MFPEQYKNTLLRLADADEDMKTLLGLFPRLKGYTTEETLAKNFTAMTGKDCTGLLKELRRNEILKIGAYYEYLCLSGYEEVFDEIAARYTPQPGDLSNYVENAVKEGDKAALTMIEMLLKIGERGTRGFTQYEFIKTYISELFSRAILESLEAGLINERLCSYGKRKDHEFLVLHQSEDTITAAEGRLKAWKRDQIAELPVIKTLETEIAELRAEAKWRIKEHRAEMADRAGMSEEELEGAMSHFTGFTIEDSSFLISATMLVERDTLNIVVTDSLSQYDMREWKNFPAVFVLEKTPKWLGDLSGVFKDAYPKLADRKLALVVPNEVAYANYKQNLLSKLVSRLGVEEIQGFPGTPMIHEIRGRK